MGEEIMYKKYGLLLVFGNLIVLLSFSSLKIAERSQYAATPVFQIQLQKEQTCAASSLKESMERTESGQRVIDYRVLEQQEESLPEDEFEILCRIVEAEAGGEDMSGRILVANVILNRVENKAFPDTIEAVVFQKNNGTFQFSPVRDGRYQKVKISNTTREAVQRALAGEDYSQGALYFVSRKAAAPEKMKWFDTHLTRLLEHGGHEFFA